MCTETMDNTTSKHLKVNCIRKTRTPSSKLRWRLLRVSAEEDEALRPCRAGSVKPTIRKYLRRDQKRAQLAKIAKTLVNTEKEDKMDSVYEESMAYMHIPPGSMAPQNTTQYLMSNAYEDELNASDLQPVPPSHGTSSHLYGESLSPKSVYSALDSDYDSCLAFQQRDFDEMCGQLW